MWVPVSDRLPDEGIPVLVADVDGQVLFASYDGDFDLFVDYNNTPFDESCGYDITHWQPLPEPPTSKSETPQPSSNKTICERVAEDQDAG